MTQRLGDVLKSIDALDPEGTIYAPSHRPLSADSPVVVAIEGSPVPAGLKYLLEVAIADDVLEVWSAWRSGRVPSADDAVAAVEWYTDHDAYMPVIE